jgi:nucleotide-binding universal stress UspA family protein
MAFTHIVVTTDFSQDSFLAFPFASHLAKVDGARLSLITILIDWQIPRALHDFVREPGVLQEYEKAQVENAQKKMRDLKEKYFPGQEVNTHVIQSLTAVAQEITEFCDKERADLIVTSTHGKGALGKILLGSVTQKVLKLSQVPVLVIPPKAVLHRKGEL